LMTLCMEENTAEELTQETFFKALQKIDEFRGQCEIRVWLCQIGKNTYLTYLKKRKRLSVADSDSVSVYGRTVQ